MLIISVYIICFFICILLLLLNEKIKLNQKSFLECIVIIILCTIAGFRDLSIGTDVNIYVKPMFQAALYAKNFSQYLEYSWFSSYKYVFVKDFEFGFSIVIYIISNIFKNISAVLFFIHLLIIVPIYKALHKVSKEFPTWISMIVFLFIYYNQTLNMMRQWIAMSFLIYGYTFLRENNTKKYIILVIVASLFHKTAIIGLIILIIFKYVQKKNVISPTINIIKVCIISVIIVFSLNIIVEFLNLIGYSKYIVYINGNLHLSINQLIIRVPILVLLIINYKKLQQHFKDFPFLITMIFLDLIFSQLATISQYSIRISVYFSEYSILSYSALCCFKYHNGSYKFRDIINIIILILYSISYWIFYYVISGSCHTVPYKFIM